MTVQDLVNQSLTLVGRLGAGRSAGAAESGVVMGLANNMLDSWSTKRLTVFTVQAATYALTAGTESYTIGTGGVFNAARPTAIESANIVATVEGASARFPMKIIGQNEWASQETYGDQSIIPKKLYYDQAFPLATIYLFPTPATNTHLEIYTWTPFTQFATLGDTLAMPPGYLRALSYNLAVEIGAAFGLQIPAAVLTIAEGSKAAIEALNARMIPQDDIANQTAAENQGTKGNKQ